MSQTLYRKYRPKNFSEIIGQKHIVKTLSNAVIHNRVGQAFLFTGPRGTGKTSIARILAKAVNCEDRKGAVSCEKCPSCQLFNSGKTLDIIEIDAASNTGVDNIRDLRETVNVAPSALKYKVYIIDEVHMLSTGAFNALLKTLEEPPSHVIFILATTEIHKVPETILSRCQRFDFTRFPIGDIIEKLAFIAKTEKVKIEKEALEMVAIAAEGGMRDAESILGQIIALEDKNITAKEVEEILGTTDRKTAADIASMLVEKNSSGAIAKINELAEGGFDLAVFNKSLVNYLRQLMLVKINPELKKHFTYEMTQEEAEKLTQLADISELSKVISAINLFVEAQVKISASVLPQLPLEIAVIKATHTFPAMSMNNEQRTVNNNSAKYSSDKSKPDLQFTNYESQENSKKEPRETKPQTNEEEKTQDHVDRSETVPSELPITNYDLQQNKNIDLYSVKSNWPKLLVDIRPYNHSLSALLTNCQAVKAEGNSVTLATPYEFYAERLNDPKNKLTIEEVLGKILECKIRLIIQIDKTLVPPKTDSSAPENAENHHQENLLDSALEIMGGKIVEE